MSNLMKPDNNETIVVAFDVDGTLIHEHDDSPHYFNIELFRKFHALGCYMIIWSGGGVDYAQRWADKLGLVAEIIPKGSISPDLVFDDMETAMGKVSVRV